MYSGKRDCTKAFWIIIIYSYTDSAEGHAVLLSVKYKETLLLERDKTLSAVLPLLYSLAACTAFWIGTFQTYD